MVEFAVLNFFESIEEVVRFAGPEYEIPVIEPEHPRLLLEAEPLARHYEVKESTV